uniref:Uncharacterized protein n=1 Tax=Oryza glaberrima TaxID=4538 RepID=I1PAV3_ORYGL
MKDPGPWNLTPVSHQDDWHVGFVYERNGVPIGAQENSYWLYIVPWGINKAVTYVKETYGNPMMILSENEWTNLATSISPRVCMILQESDITEIT